MNKQKIILVVLFFGAIGSAQEFNDRTNLPPINISNAIQSAIQEHPQADIARDSIELAEQGVRGARADFLPTSGVSYDISQNKNPLALGLGLATMGTSGVNVSQSIFNLSSFFSYQASKERLKAATYSAASTDVRMAAQALGTYIEVLRLRLTLEFAKEHLDYLEDLRQSIQKGDLKGRATPDDLILIESEYGKVLTEKYKGIDQAKASESNFLRDTRLEAPKYFLVEPEPLSIPEGPEGVAAIGRAQNPGFKALEAGITANEKDVKAANAGYLPRVDAVASAYKFGRPGGDFKEYNIGGASVGITVTVPLFDPRRGPNIASRKIDQRLASSQLQNVINNWDAEVAKTYSQINIRNMGIKGLCDGLQNRLKTVESMRSRLVSQVTVQDLLFQKQELVKNGVNLFSEFLAEVLDTYNVHVLMGTIVQDIPEALNDSNRPAGPNPQLMGMEVYQNLLQRCTARGH